MCRLERFIRLIESDEVFEPLQIVIVPAVLWLGLMVYCA